jgi:hypothetical protein
MSEWNQKELVELIKELEKSEGNNILTGFSSLRKKVTDIINLLKEEELSNIFNIKPIKQKVNGDYCFDENQLNAIFLILLLDGDDKTEDLFEQLIEKKRLINSTNNRIEKFYKESKRIRNNNRNKEKNAKKLEKIKKESFELYKLMEEYSKIVSKIQDYDYKRLNKYESKCDYIKTGKIINQYKDYIGFMSMEKEVKSYLSQVFEHVSSYTPELAQKVIDELKEEELTKINIKKKLMEVKLSYSERAEVKNHKLVKLVENLELDERYYND